MLRFAQVFISFFSAMALGVAAQSSTLPATQAHPNPGAKAQSGITLPATESVVYNFGETHTDGINPKAGLIQASDGNFYGVTESGGALTSGFNYGTIFRLTPAGEETTLYSFTGLSDGCNPDNTLIQASDGNLYGATTSCGDPDNYNGTIFQYNLKTGTLTTVYTNGESGRIVATFIDDGKDTLYGVDEVGGVNQVGSLWSLNYKSNAYTTLYSFTDGSDGAYPLNSLVLAADGNLYGTALHGVNSDGVAFMLGTDGSNFQVIHQFTGGADGSIPADLVQYSDGNLYGIASRGGANGLGVFFRLTPNGASTSLTSLYNFVATSDGHSPPYGHPFIGGDGKFYVSGFLGGVNGGGQIMQLDSQGNKADVYDFTSFVATYDPPLEAADGNLYGTTYLAGSHGDGFIYRLATGLPPVITLTPSAATVDYGKPVTLTWGAVNAYSRNAQACFASSSDGSWTGSVASSGSVAVIPTSPGAVNYAVTCGGVETANASVIAGSSAPLAIASTSLPHGVLGASYFEKLAATGGTPPYVWSIASGTLPAGLSLAADGTITGVAAKAGTENFMVSVTDSQSTPVTVTGGLSITVSSFGIITTSLANGVTGDAYAQTLAADGGTLPYTWSVTAGSLPAGLTLSPNTGVIAGTPSMAGAFNFTVQAVDSSSGPANSSASLSIDIAGMSPVAALPATEYLFWSFNESPGDGVQPVSGLIQASDGNFYGTTCCGGVNGGTLYQLTPTGQEAIVYNFTVGAAGYGPSSTLVEASDGNLYGTTVNSGSLNGGTLYQYNLKTGALVPLYDFPAVSYATGDLIDDGQGTLYGTTQGAGDNSDGSVWSYNYKSNTFTNLYSFTGGADGKYPLGGVALASDGNLYGLTFEGGSGYGTAFVVGTDGSNFHAFHAFSNGADGGNSQGELVQYSDGNLYGFNDNGGNGSGVFFQIVPNGANSTVKPVYAFKSSDGSQLQYGHPFIGGDGKFYIAGRNGGATGNGQLMQLDALGNEADVYDVGVGSSDGSYPESQPFESTDGNLYGSLYLSGGASAGAVYQVITTLPPVITIAADATGGATAGSVALAWSANNLYSKNAQVCIARSTDGSWSGPVATSGSATVTPTGYSAVTYAITCGGAESALVTVNGNTPLAVSTTSLPSGTIYAPYSAQILTASGGTPPYTWSITNGALPDGLSLAAKTGVITGVPTQAGVATFTVQVTDSQSVPVMATANLSINITSSQLGIVTTGLPNGAVGSAYSQVLAATGGVAPYTWSVSSGALPAGLSLNASSGLISGTPTQVGTSTVAVRVTDSAATPAGATLSYSLTIAAQPPAITTNALADGVVGSAYSVSLVASGGKAPYTWSVASGFLPAGVTLNTATGWLSGTPLAAGISNFTIQITDSEPVPATAAARLTLVIDAAPVVLTTPTVAVTATPVSIAPGGTTSFKAAVASPAGSPSPTGTVQFQSNGASVGPQLVLGADGTATLPSQSFPNAGSYAITASYSGDTNFNPANSPATTLTVVAPAAPAVTANPTAITISAPGASGSTNLTVANFSSGTIAFSCAGLPQGASCNFGTLSSAGVSVLQITTTGSSTTAKHSPLANGSPPTFYALALPGLAALIGLIAPIRRNKRYLHLTVLGMMLLTGLTLSACGGSSTKPPSGGGTPAGTSTVTVTASAGTQSATILITLTVQ